MSDERTISITEDEAQEVLDAFGFCDNYCVLRVAPSIIQKFADAFPRLGEEFAFLLSKES